MRVSKNISKPKSGTYVQNVFHCSNIWPISLISEIKLYLYLIPRSSDIHSCPIVFSYLSSIRATKYPFIKPFVLLMTLTILWLLLLFSYISHFILWKNITLYVKKPWHKSLLTNIDICLYRFSVHFHSNRIGVVFKLRFFFGEMWVPCCSIESKRYQGSKW